MGIAAVTNEGGSGRVPLYRYRVRVRYQVESVMEVVAENPAQAAEKARQGKLEPGSVTMEFLPPYILPPKEGESHG